MNLQDTVEMMNSSDYKERFKAEFYQLKLRIDGLDVMLTKYKNGTLEFTPSCDIALLETQIATMVAYENILKMRAKQEGIELPSFT